MTLQNNLPSARPWTVVKPFALSPIFDPLRYCRCQHGRISVSSIHPAKLLSPTPVLRVANEVDQRKSKLHLGKKKKKHSAAKRSFWFLFPKGEQRREWRAENKCGGVEKASWLGEVGRLWVRLILTTIMWPNQIPSLLSSPALCKERVWPGAHVQIWVPVIGLLPTVAKVKLLCALLLLISQSHCCIPCSAASPTFYYCSLEVGAPAWVASGLPGLFVSISSFPF